MSSSVIFRRDSANDYHTIISSLLEQSDLMSLGNPYFLDIDYDALMQSVRVLTDRFQKELQQQVEEYSNFRFAHSFVYNCFSYALVNHHSNVGKDEIAGMFKAWDFVPFSLNKQMVDALFETMDFEGVVHPYHYRAKGKQMKKIIAFPTRLVKKG